MTLQDLEYALELNGVMRRHIDQLLLIGKQNGIDIQKIDDELEEFGYERIFENGFDDYWDDDDEFDHVQKIKPKHKFIED
jgi:hypothetical protein